jgi:hypothetical protein
LLGVAVGALLLYVTLAAGLKSGRFMLLEVDHRIPPFKPSKKP